MSRISTTIERLGAVQGQMFRFAVVGLVSNLVLYLVYLALTEWGVGPKTAMTGLYVLGVLQTFVFNKRWTFRHRGHVTPAFVRYVIAYAIGYVLNLAVLWLLVDHLGLAHQWVQGGMILTLALGFFLAQKYWIFPVRTPQSPVAERP